MVSLLFHLDLIAWGISHLKIAKFPIWVDSTLKPDIQSQGLAKAHSSAVFIEFGIALQVLLHPVHKKAAGYHIYLPKKLLFLFYFLFAFWFSRVLDKEAYRRSFETSLVSRSCGPGKAQQGFIAIRMYSDLQQQTSKPMLLTLWQPVIVHLNCATFCAPKIF